MTRTFIGSPAHPRGGVDRRTFMKLGAAAGGSAAAASIGFGLTSTAVTPALAADPYPVDEATGGEWRTAPCWHNCSCGNSRCLIQALVVDGVPVRLRTDTFDAEDPDLPQYRACPRGRAQIQHVMAANRIKYPMVRKGWEPGGGNKDLRGRDEWRRVSWDEALDLAATEIKRIYDEYGPKSVFYGAWGDGDGEILWDPMARIFNRLGGSIEQTGTVSFGAWPLVEALMVGSFGDANDRVSMREAKLIVLIGCNWASNKGGNTAHYLHQAKQAGAKLIFIDPWLNRTAAALADEWIPVRPGTDTAFFLGVAHHMITSGLHDQEFLDKYCLGFDAEHMPDGADPEENFKDYVLGTHDGEPKTPEWASPICGVDARVIRQFAEEIATTKPTSFYAGQSTSKIPAGEQWCQVFYTVGWMTGNVGRPGANVAWHGPEPVAQLVTAGRYGDPIQPNPLKPPLLTFGVTDINHEGDWSAIDYSEVWQGMLDGEYGRDSWPGGRKKIDIKMIYHGHAHFQNSIPNAMAGVEVARKVDFVLASCLHYNANAQFADIVFPISTLWERPHGQLMADVREHAIYWQPIMEPLFESKPDLDVVVGLAERLGFDVDEVMGGSWKQKEFNTLAKATVTLDADEGPKPLVTITAADIAEWGVEGEPQQGEVTIAELQEKGIYKVPRKLGDGLTHIANEKFIEDPEANPLPTASGKFEIHNAALAAAVNQIGFDQISPIGKYQEAQPDHGWHARTEEFPLIMFTPHSLRRAHTNLDNVGWLRQAFQQECFMSSVDAQERGLKTNDTALLTSPHGKMLRRVKVLEHMVPGAIAIEDGGWMDLDDDGVDRGGCPNVLQAPKAAGQGLQAWTGTLVQVEKAATSIEPDYLREPKLPKGEGVN